MRFLENSPRISDRLKLYQAPSQGTSQGQTISVPRKISKNARECFVFRDGITRRYPSVVEAMRALRFRLSTLQYAKLRHAGWAMHARDDLVIWFMETPSPIGKDGQLNQDLRSLK